MAGDQVAWHTLACIRLANTARAVLTRSTNAAYAATASQLGRTKGSYPDGLGKTKGDGAPLHFIRTAPYNPSQRAIGIGGALLVGVGRSGLLDSQYAK